MTPYRIRSRSVSVRRRRGPESVVVSLPKPLPLAEELLAKLQTAIRVYSRKPRTSPPVRHSARLLVFNRFNPSSLRNFPLLRNTKPPRSCASHVVFVLHYRTGHEVLRWCLILHSRDDSAVTLRVPS